MSAEKSPSSNDPFLCKLKRRRKKYIDPKQQTRLMFEIILMVMTLPILFYIFTISDLWAKIFFGDQAHQIQVVFLEHFKALKSAWHVLLFIIAFIAVLSIYFTHKIFGPIFRFRQVLQAKLDGEDDVHFALRKGDYFQEFSELIRQIALCKVEVPHDVELRSTGDVFDMQGPSTPESAEEE